jgi:hypothetical protein
MPPRSALLPNRLATKLWFMGKKVDTFPRTTTTPAVLESPGDFSAAPQKISANRLLALDIYRRCAYTATVSRIKDKTPAIIPGVTFSKEKRQIRSR